MDSKRELKRILTILISLCLVSILSIFFIKLIFLKTTDRNFPSAEQYEKILREKEQKLNSILLNILKTEIDQIPFISLHQQIQPELWQKEGLTILLYQGDSLVFWSNNNVPAGKILDKEKLSSRFIHFGNGWFRVLTEKNKNLLVVGLILVKNEYPYQNEYLVNDFQDDFEIIPGAKVDTIPGKINVSAESGEFLFSVSPEHNESFNRRIELVIFLFWIVFVISFIIFLFFAYHLFSFLTARPLLLFLCFLFDAFLFRFVLLYFEIPAVLYESDIFSPFYFATSWSSPSLGDLVINSLFLLTLASLLFKFFPGKIHNYSTRKNRAVSFGLTLLTGLLFFFLIRSLNSVVIDSNIELNLNNIFNVDFYSALGFLSIISLIMAFFLASAAMFLAIRRVRISRNEMLTISTVVTAVLSPLFLVCIEMPEGVAYLLFFFINLLLLLYFSGKERKFNSITSALVFIVMFSSLATFILDVHLDAKEKEKRKIIAAELASKRDPLMEFEFYRTSSAILTDTALNQLLNKWSAGKADESEVHTFLLDNFFKNFWNNYELMVTLCKPEDMLDIQPEGYLENCYTYFDRLFSSRTTESLGNGLYFHSEQVGMSNYIAGIDFNLGTNDSKKPEIGIFVEISQKYLAETGLGYPDLLIDQKVKMITGLDDYSYAKYSGNELTYKNGDFYYNLDFKRYNRPDENSYFVDSEGYNHYINKSENGNTLIISKKTVTFLDLIAPFSYLFIMISLFLLIFLFGYFLTGGLQRIEFNFSNQLQLSIIFIIIVSFLILGMISRNNIIYLYNNKNRDNLSEKTFSVLTELEHKLGQEEVITPDMQPYVADLLYKFSEIFFSDINMFSTEGDLIASSRPQIFNEKLLSGKMNPEAYYRLAFDKTLLLIQNEKIGGQEYLSAYIPFRNNKDQIVAYLNLPYFAKQTELRKEIGDFLAAYINVYVLLIVLAIMVTILVSRLISRPLQLIREKMAEIGLGKTNEKIEWKRKDEIGRLVEEYNRMIDELARSAELLARSERESAWREMAKQVAHEIKNPLTPMKLSVQYLKKAWDDKAPDWDKQLARFTNTIVEQIDTLSEIASEFSDFAKMPPASIDQVDLVDVVSSAADLYRHQSNIEIILKVDERNCFVMADQKQLLRVFNNLVQNSVQAIGQKQDGLINIHLFKEDDFCCVDLTDNGSGITEEQATKIFSPSFTTKSSGMGLGLAMAKSILTSIRGYISFESKPGEGTIFRLKIPLKP